MAAKRGPRLTSDSELPAFDAAVPEPVLITGVNYEDPLRILVIGGGTGLSSILSGLKYYARPDLRTIPHPHAFPLPPEARVELSAVVTVTDDGGSSGRLRREFDVLPPGDIRNCMVALSEDATLLSRLFQYRFASGRGLKGHSFGNLFLTVLTQLTGDFAQAIKVSSEVLAITGKIYPSTASKVELRAKLVNGREVKGETNISKSREAIQRVFIHPRNAEPLPETLEAIAKADLICLGPGSLFTSVIPNLLVKGVAEAIRRSPAVKTYFCNLMWQPGETMHFHASDHVKAINEHARCNLVDCIIVNTRPIGSALRTRYAAEKVRPVDVDAEVLIDMGLRLVEDELLADAEKVRHDPERAAALAVRMAVMARKKRERAIVLNPDAAKAGK